MEAEVGGEREEVGGKGEEEVMGERERRGLEKETFLEFFVIVEGLGEGEDERGRGRRETRGEKEAAREEGEERGGREVGESLGREGREELPILEGLVVENKEGGGVGGRGGGRGGRGRGRRGGGRRGRGVEERLFEGFNSRGGGKSEGFFVREW